MASHDMNGTGDSTNIVTIDASDEDAEPRAEACRSFDISRALLDVLNIHVARVAGTMLCWLRSSTQKIECTFSAQRGVSPGVDT